MASLIALHLCKKNNWAPQSLVSPDLSHAFTEQYKTNHGKPGITESKMLASIDQDEVDMLINNTAPKVLPNMKDIEDEEARMMQRLGFE